jgi:hypothetical protein
MRLREEGVRPDSIAKVSGGGERTAPSGERRTRFRSRFAIVAITAALTAGMLTALGVAVPVSAATRIQATPSAADPHKFQSVNLGLYITGATHGGQLYLSGGGTSYTLYSKGGNTHALSANNLCWNAAPEANMPVVMSSCIGSDHNEWFVTIYGEGTNHIALQQASSGLYVSIIDGAIFLEPAGIGYQTWIEH